jgi:hypothetical protein
MPDLQDALQALAEWLDREHVPYMVIGGFAATMWGEPRFTRDLDVTVLVADERLDSVVRQLCSDFTALVADPLRFVGETRVLPLMVVSTPVDVIFAALPYEEQAIARARTIKLSRRDVQVCSPEDLILHKIVSPRPRDHDDVESIFRHRSADLDFAYLDPRVEELADALADRTMLDRYRALRSRWRKAPQG